MILETNPFETASIAIEDLPVSIQISRFRGDGGVEEIQWIIRPTQYAHFDTQLEWVEQAYEQALQSMELSMDTAVWRRFLCSDLINQVGALKNKSFSNPKPKCGVYAFL